MKSVRWLIVALLCVVAPASAFWQSRNSNYNQSIGGATYQGPGDVQSGAVGFWGFRAYNAAYGAAKAAKICDAATGLTCSDVNFLSNGYFDAATAAGLTQCSISCNVQTLYDSTGNGNDLAQSTNGNRPLLVFNALNTYACASFTASATMYLTKASMSASLPISVISVAKRTANFTTLQYILGLQNTSPNNFGLSFRASANTVGYANSGTAVTVGSTADSSFHALQGIGTSTTQYIYADGSTNNSANGGVALNSTVNIGLTTSAVAPLDGIVCEAGIWGSTDFVANSKTTSLNSNMHAAYGSW